METTRRSGAGVGSRTAQDACATLVELGRALKGWMFYQPESPARRDLVERAWRVFQGEIDRNGPLALDVRRGALWLAGTEIAVGTGRLDDLARRLAERSVERLVFGAGLDAETLGAFLDALLRSPAEGSFASLLFGAPRHGVSINDTDWAAFLRTAASDSASALDTTLPDLDDSEAALPVRYRGDASQPPDIDLLVDLDPAPAAPEPVPDAPADELGERLRELDDCDDDALYRAAARQLALDARTRVQQGDPDAGYRVLVAFAAQAGDDGKRSFSQRESARECLVQLGQGAALGDLMRRCCEADGDASVQALEALRALGAPAVPRLLDEIEVAPAESERHRRLASALIAIGDDTVPALADAIGSRSIRRQLAALRLAGEAQNPGLAASLRDVLKAGAPEATREAARALGRIADVVSLEMLSEALESKHASIVSAAAHALAATNRALAVPPLAAALDRALVARQSDAARDLVRAIGRLARPEGVPVLCDLLARGGFFQRQRLRELKVAAVHALAHIPGRAADEALARAARSGNAQQRQAAELAARSRRLHDPARSQA